MPALGVAVAAAAASSAAASSAAIAAWGAAYLGSATLASALASSIAGLAVSYIGNAIIGQKGSKKSAPNLGSDLQTGLKQVARLSDDTYKIIYGKARIAGTLAFFESSDAAPDSDGVSQSGDNLFLHLVIIRAGHEVTSFEEDYLDDDLITLDANGFVQEDKYKKNGKSYVRIRHHLGSDDQAADPVLMAETKSWTSAHRLRGLPYTYMRLQWDNEVFQSGIPTLNSVIKGKKVYDPRDQVVDDGLVTQSVTETVDYGTVTDHPDYLVIDDGLVTDEVLSGLRWSDNAALIIRDYIFSRDSAGVPYGFGATADEIDDSYTTTAANISDEGITKRDGSVIKRYTINGVVDTSATPIDNLESLQSALAGAVTYPTGKFRIHAGAYDIPDDEVIDESWLSGEMEVTHRISRDELFNAVRGTYTNPNRGWQNDEFPALTSIEYEEQDNGEQIFSEIELPYTIDPEAAQRIAKIVQRKGREQITVLMPCNYRALKYTVWDNVKISNTTHGWDGKVFKIVNLAYDLRNGVNLTFREENSASYNWDVTDAEAIAAAPDTNLPNPFAVMAPSGVAYDSRAVTTAGGDQIFNLVLSWAAHSDAFVRHGGSFEIQFRLSSDTEWRPSFSVPGDQTTADIVSNSVNTSYDLRIRAINTMGAKSNWSYIDDAIIGYSGGTGASDDWGNWTTSATTSLDWGNWTTAPSATDDWGYYI